MNSKALKLFSASAGSGKTYRLTLEYIKLALFELEPKGYFRRILAVTFTIKAAEEMRTRIIYFLTGISSGPNFNTFNESEKKDFLQIISKIKAELEIEGVVLTQNDIILRAQITLQQILQDYGLFSVMTIDSFVQRLSSSFVDELDLPNQFDVIIDTKMLINQLIDRILDKVNENGDAQLRELLLSFAQNEVEEGKNWNQLRKSLQDFFRICFSESFFHVEKDITKFSIFDFNQIESKVGQTLKDHLTTLLKLAEEFNQEINKSLLPVNVFTYGERGPVAYFKKFVLDPKIESNKFANLLKACENNSWAGAKVDSLTKSQIDSISNSLSSIGQQFVETYQQVSYQHQLFALIKKDLKKMALLSSVQNELKEYQNENSSISISEFSRKIYEVISNDPVPFIYEKLGDRYFHILIDEFQDTSILQWQNFMPLIENAVSIHKKNLLVGDAKQSIYKFRSGEVGLIASLSSQNKDLVSHKLSNNELDQERFSYLINQTETNNLESNYRSSKEIVDFNNQFYSWISNQEEFIACSDLLKPVYGQNLIQKPEIPEEKLPGQVDFLVLEKNLSSIENAQMESDWMLQQVLNLIRLNVEHKNFQFKDIAILTRKNKDANYLALQLKERNIPVISADSLLVHYSPIVTFLISFLKLINQPNSELIFHELMFINADINQISLKFELLEEFKKDSNVSYLQKAFQFIQQGQTDLSNIDFSSNSIVNISYALIGKFNLFHKSESQDYLLKYLDIVNEFALMKSDTISDFLEFYEENKSNLSIASPDDQNAITISSIHKSKGLEYPVVILPFASWTHQASQEEIWFDITQEGQFDELFIEEKGPLNKFYLKIRNKFFEESEYLTSQKKIELNAIFLDSLNMLYVATTRPKQQLHILVTKVSEEITTTTKTFYKNSIGKILVDFIEQNANKKEVDQHFLTDYNEYTSYYLMNKEVKKAIHFTRKSSAHLKLISLEPRLEKKPGLRISSTKNELFSKAANKRKKGELAHLILSKVDSMETIAIPTSNDFMEFENTIISALKNPEINKYFQKGELLFAEQDILCPNGEIIRPDRVVRFDEETIIIDFKTGKKSDNHHVQVKKYVSALQSMGYENSLGIIIYLESQEIVYV